MVSVIMTLQQPSRRLVHPVPLALLVLGVAGFLLTGGSLPHIHGPDHPGLHNQEHDLSYLATFGSAGPVPDAPAVAPLALVVLLVIRRMASQPAVAPTRHADFRAPPVR